MKRQRRSSMVRYFLVGLAALSACDADDKAHVQDCVDKDGIVVPERFCQGKLPDAGAMTVEERNYYNTYIVPRGPMYYPTFVWHYDDVYVPIGSHVWGGSYAPSVNYTYIHSTEFHGAPAGRVSVPSAFGGGSAVSRGGFGAVGRSQLATAIRIARQAI